MRLRPLSALLPLALALGGCGGGGSSSAVELENDTSATDGKALVLTASTDEKLVQQGGNLLLELRGVDAGKDPRSSYEKPDYTAPIQCTTSPCEWTVVPDKASTYEFKAFVVDVESHEAAGSSDPVEAEWNAPPRPEDFTFTINGKRFPLTPATETIDEYLPIPPGDLEVEAKWSGDAGETGYAVVITNGQVDETCSTGTSCVVSDDVTIRTEQEMNWHLNVQTLQGGKPVESFQVCLVGNASKGA